MRFLTSAAALLLLLPALAQRGPGRASPFTDFHKQAELAAGQPAPCLFAKDTQGRVIDLRDYLGQWVFIEFGSYT